MQVGSNQLFLLDLAKKQGYISPIDVMKVYGLTPNTKSVMKSKMILEKMVFKRLILKTEQTEILGCKPVTKFVLTKKGRDVLETYTNRSDNSD